MKSFGEWLSDFGPKADTLPPLSKQAQILCHVCKAPIPGASAPTPQHVAYCPECIKAILTPPEEVRETESFFGLSKSKPSKQGGKLEYLVICPVCEMSHLVLCTEEEFKKYIDGDLEFNCGSTYCTP